MQPCTEDHPRESARHLEGIHGTFTATAQPLQAKNGDSPDTQVEKESEEVSDVDFCLMPSFATAKLEADLLTQHKSDFHSQGLCSLRAPPSS